MINIPIGRKVMTILALMALPWCMAQMHGQLGAYERFAEVLVNSTYNSSEQAIYLPGHSNHSAIVTRSGNGTVAPVLSLGGNTLELVINYTPDPGFTGLDTIVVEVTVGGPPIPLANIYYAQFVFHVIPSIVTTGEDYYTVVKGSTANYLPVDSNDSSTASELAIVSVPAVMGGSIDLVNDSLYYNPNADFTGMAYLTYVVCDSVHTCRSEVVNICVVDTVSSGSSDTTELMTAVTDELTSFLPSSSYFVTLSPQHGSVSFIPNSDAFVYTPGNTLGMDYFEISDGTHFKFYEIDVLADEVNSFVFDDYYSVLKGDQVSFNVKANDRTGNFFVASYSQPDYGTLYAIGDGRFTYLADSLFTGEVSFDYEVCALQNCETGTVFISVGEFVPNDQVSHDMTVVKNHDLIINYQVPIHDYEFTLTSPATNGVVNIHAGLDTISDGCVESIGRFMIIYTPDSGFEGFDEFTLSYCAAGACTDVDVYVEVIDVVIYDTCVCQDQCVWPGDVDFNGVVDMTDLLCLGNVLGDVGVNRPFPDPSNWYGHFGQDWESQMRPNYMANEKHCDTDGDGIISVLDTMAISKFYDAAHTLVPEQIVTVKPYPVGLELDLDTIPAIGDTITVYITIGESAVPAENLTGVALNISFDPNTVDSAFTTVRVVPENWLTRESLPLFMNKNDDVNFELGLSRIDREDRHGYGRVFAVDIIIDDDLDGLRPTDDRIPINLHVHDIVGMQKNGKPVVIPSRSLTFYARIPGETNDTEKTTFKVYPNPVSDILFLDLELEDVSSIAITDMNGRLVQLLEGQQLQRRGIVTADLTTGLYIIEARTSTGVKTAKFLKR